MFVSTKVIDDQADVAHQRPLNASELCRIFESAVLPADLATWMKLAKRSLRF